MRAEVVTEGTAFFKKLYIIDYYEMGETEQVGNRERLTLLSKYMMRIRCKRCNEWAFLSDTIWLYNFDFWKYKIETIYLI